MALLKLEGFDHYNAVAEIGATDFLVSGIGSYATLETGRYGQGQSLFFNDDYGNLTIVNTASTQEMILGFAYKKVNQYNILDSMIYTKDGSGNNNLWARVDYGGYLFIGRNTGAYDATMGYSSKPIPFNVWVYLEFKFYVDNSPNGYVEVRMNGEEIINETGLDTSFSANSWGNIILYGCDSDCYFDDIYLADDTGTIVNDFLGDIKVETSYPEAVGTTTQLTASGTPGGTGNWDYVNDPYTATDYVSSSTSGHEDTYNVDNLASDADNVYGVQVTVRGSKDDSGTKTVNARSKSGTNQQTGPNMGLEETVANHTHLFEQSASGSTNWTDTLVNAAEFGVKVT